MHSPGGTPIAFWEPASPRRTTAKTSSPTRSHHQLDLITISISSPTRSHHQLDRAPTLRPSLLRRLQVGLLPSPPACEVAQYHADIWGQGVSRQVSPVSTKSMPHASIRSSSPAAEHTPSTCAVHVLLRPPRLPSRPTLELLRGPPAASLL